MTKQVTKKDLAPLAGFINKMYDGDLCAFNHYISKAVYMLHYVPEESFKEREKQDVCFALNKIRECLHKADQKRKREAIQHIQR